MVAHVVDLNLEIVALRSILDTGEETSEDVNRIDFKVFL